MEAIEYRGLWWLASNTNRKLAGVLTCSPSEEFKLELIGTFNEEYDGTILAPLKGTQIESVILGQSSDGSNITLFECACRISHKGCAEFSTAVYKARSIAIGLHLASLNEKRFFKAYARIPELSYWLYPSILQQTYTDQENGGGIAVKLDKIPADQREVAKINISKKISVCLCRDASYKSGDLCFNPSFEQFTSLQIESTEDMSLKEFYELIVRYESFLSFATFREVGYTDLTLFSKDNYNLIGLQKFYKPIIIDTIFHTKPCNKKIEKHKFIFDYNSIKEQYPRAIKQWFRNYWKFDAIRGHFLDSIDYHGSFSYINFLIVIQAVEGFGRRFMQKQISAYRKSLPPDTKSKALHEILSAVFRYYVDVKCIDQETDLEAIAETRNYHSHLLPQKSKKAVETIDLYGLTEELRKVLICCILTYLGFSNQEINNITTSTNNDLFG